MRNPKPRLYPHGTPLARVPADARGLTWSEYIDHLNFSQARPAAVEPDKPAAKPEPRIASQAGLFRRSHA